MLSRTSEYALHALIYLARHPECAPCAVRVIADKTNIPPRYLSKILRDLVRLNVVKSRRGKKGGFELARLPEEISLFEAVEPFEPMKNRTCPFGRPECSDENPCPVHPDWKRMLEQRIGFLKIKNISDLLADEAPLEMD